MGREELSFTAEILGLHGSSEASWLSVCEKARDQTRHSQIARTLKCQGSGPRDSDVVGWLRAWDSTF